MRTISAALLAAAMALLLSACGGSTSTNVVTLPQIITAPVDVTVAPGQTATFVVTATSPQPLSFQWYRDGTAIADATTATYTTPAAVLADNGALFSATIRNGAGVTSTTPATLFVSTSSTPPEVSTTAGATQGSADGSGTAAQFSLPQGLAADAAGNLYVADTANHRIRMISPGGVVSTLAGSDSAGTADGIGAAAQFKSPQGIAVDAAGTTLYVADTGNSNIRVIAIATAQVTTLAGSGSSGYADGSGSAARFASASGVAVDGAGNIFVADTGNSVIRQITPAGVVTTLAGTAGTPGATDGTGAAALFHGPSGIAADGAGNLYVSDSFNGLVRKIAPGAVVTLIAGNGSFRLNDGKGAAASFGFPAGIAIDAAGNLYTADFLTHAIRKITPDTVVTTLAGNGLAGFVDGTGGRTGPARFASPFGVAVGVGGEVYIADTANHRIRKIVQP